MSFLKFQTMRLFVVLFMLSASGCSTIPGYDQIPGVLVGSWEFTNQELGPQILHFKKDGTYELDLDRNGVANIWGVYRISKNWLILNDIGGEGNWDCGQQGAYAFRIHGRKLVLTLMADQCLERRDALAASWSRAIQRIQQ